MKRLHWRIGAALALLAAGAGCAVDQDKEVATYRQVLEVAGEKQLEFRRGDPLPLNTAMLLANRHNERLAIEGESFLQAIIDKKRAVAAFLPTVNLVPSHAFRDSKGLAPGQGTTSSELAVTAGANLFNGFSDVARLRGSAFSIEERRNLLLDEQETLLLDVAMIYYQVMRSQRSVEVLQDSLKVQEERVRYIEGRQQAGTARPLDVAQTRAEESATRVQLIEASNDVLNARSVLTLLTGAPVGESALTDDFAPPPAIPEMEAMVALAQQRRHDLAAAVAAVAAERQGVEAAFGQYFPSVSLNLTGVIAADPSDGPDWDGLIRANLPLFSAGLIHADVREAWSRFRQASARHWLLFRQVRQQLETAYQNFIASQKRLAELQTQVSAAEEAFRQAEQSYNVGLATNLERLSAQNQVLEARLALASEMYELKFYYLNLLRVSGGMRLEDHILPADPWRSLPTTQPSTQPATRPAP